MLCPLPSSAAGFLLALWELRAPGWPWRCISFPAALPPLSGPQSTAPEAGRQTPGSAGCCSCMLQMSCCQPPDEKQERRQLSKYHHKKQNKFKHKKAILIHIFAIANLAIVPHGLIAFRVNIICIQSEVGKFPLQAVGFDLLKGCFANKVSRLSKHKGKLFI